MYKKIKHLIPAFDINMGGILLKQALPAKNVDDVNPFLLLHHGKFTFDAHSKAIHQGIGPHPHRGFSPVSFIIEGDVHHRDSRGNNQIAEKGEVQWMHAGAGVIHSERPSESLAEKNGTLEVVQLWINSPANKKMDIPNYQYINKSEMRVFTSLDGKFSNKLIAGTYNNLQGKIKTESDLLIIWGEAQPGAIQTLSIPKNFSSMLYVISGELTLTNYGKVKKESLVVFDNNEEDIEMTTDSEVQFLVLSGAQINEPIVKHGAFVMNTQTEIMEAMRDYQMGKMGVLIE